MSRSSSPLAQRVILEGADFPRLLTLLKERGYRVIGPTVRDGAVVLDQLASAEELPVGWTDQQDSGTYRLQRGERPTLFSHGPGPHSWKKFLFPPRQRLFAAERRDAGFTVMSDSGSVPKQAFLGMRACDLQALGILDRVFLGGDYADANYRSRREGLLVVAVHCTTAGGTCFCASMGSGPRAPSGFDLALTEVTAENRHYFLMEAGSEPGAALCRELGCPEAGEADMAAAGQLVERAASRMGRRLETEGLAERLQTSREHPRWEDAADRCLGCANCTLVCPTCFCNTVEDQTDLTGARAERRRRWDSCFTLDFSYIHGGSIRPSSRGRYRHWLTHKLGTWHEQFGTSGCVGCGRCITWCPVSIDITEEAAALCLPAAGAAASPRKDRTAHRR